MTHSRRHILKLMGGVATTAILAPVLSGCGDPKTGPEKVTFDRDTCTLCRMIISDVKFTAQVRTAHDGRVYKFDDIGCATHWLNDKPWASDLKNEIWVADYASTREDLKWLKARDASYEHGPLSPMNYNFAAHNAMTDSHKDFVHVTQTLLAGMPNHVCAVPVENT